MPLCLYFQTAQSAELKRLLQTFRNALSCPDRTSC